MSKQLNENKAREILSEVRTIKTFAAKLEVQLLDFLSGVGAAPENQAKQESEQQHISKFYSRITVKNENSNTIN